MIRRPISSPSRHARPPGSDPAVAAAPVPSWLRRAVPDAQSLAGKEFGQNALEDIALAAGAAIGALDQIVRRQEPWAGVWRQRLTLAAAALTAKQAGRVEDEAALRDAVLLTRPGDFLSVGPAGSLLLAWRRLAARPTADLFSEENLASVLQEFGHACDPEAVGGLADTLRQLSFGAGMIGMLTGAIVAAERFCFGRNVGCWLADALLAQRLGWAHALPLFGTEPSLAKRPARPRRSTFAPEATEGASESERAKKLLAAQARAALRAIDLSDELGRRAERLLGAAPKLRAKGADVIVDHLLNEDALVASRGDRSKKNGMSDRAQRRLFDRLQKLGVVRELSGRPIFRIYGL